MNYPRNHGPTATPFRRAFALLAKRLPLEDAALQQGPLQGLP